MTANEPKQRQDLAEAAAGWDRDRFAKKIEQAHAERESFVERFPAGRWPDVALEEYALGLPQSTDGFSYWLEFKTVEAGSIKGGSAYKHLVYRRRNAPGWYFEEKRYGSEAEAWEAIRHGFAQLVELAAAGEWDEIDLIDALRAAPSVRGKTAWMYHPTELLPIYADQHLDYFLRLFKIENRSGASVAKSRRLLTTLRGVPAFDGWHPLDIMHFLYSWAHPNPSHTVLKIAPGERAALWDDCLANGYIRVGWDELDDLTGYDDRDDILNALMQVRPERGKSANSRAARGLDEFRSLEDGDIVVANRGTSTVVGIGRVDGGYQFRPDLPNYRHVVYVDWYDTTERHVDFGSAWMSTIVRLKSDQLHTITNAGSGTAASDASPVEVPVPKVHLEAERLLERSGQVIFFGPPGTGKTYTARRHATWLVAGGSGDPAASAVFASTAHLVEREHAFSVVESDGDGVDAVPQLTRVTFHPTYSYEDFIEGYKPTESGGGGLELYLRDGLFKRVCRAAARDPERPYVVIIDEINRGNVPKIFGELITLIENDKRGVTVTLPQSGDAFQVPPNVFLIGTMNTADRSIHVLDAALRRRFSFLELLPEPEVLEGAMVGGLPLDDCLRELNALIREHIGREKQIGHAMLMNGTEPITSAEDFALVFRYELLPLLQEYAYGDYGDLARLLGEEIIDLEQQTPNAAIIDDPQLLASALATHLEVSSG